MIYEIPGGSRNKILFTMENHSMPSGDRTTVGTNGHPLFYTVTVLCYVLELLLLSLGLTDGK